MKKETEFRRFKYNKEGLCINPDTEFERESKLVKYRLLIAQHQIGYSTGYFISTLEEWPAELFKNGVAVSKGASFPKKEDALYDAACRCFEELKEIFESNSIAKDELIPLHQYIIDLKAGKAPDFSSVKFEPGVGHDQLVEQAVNSGFVENRLSKSGQEKACVEKEEDTSSWKCRVCGCTDDNCAQCVRLTGSPCHWVEPNLCSACTDAVIQSPINDNEMNFFQQLADAGHVDFSFRIMQKNKNLTININPGGTPRSLMPMNFTATPEELDRVFFEKIVPAVKEVTGLVSNIDAVKKQAAELPAEKSETGNTSKSKSKAKPAAKAKVSAKKVIKPAPPEMFPES